MSIIDFPVLQGLVAVDYVTQLHECTDLEDFDPVECVPCSGCGHAECRHRVTNLPAPIATIGMTPTQYAEAKYAEAAVLHAAITASPCEVASCDCTRMMCGDECRTCGGEGTIESETGRTYACTACNGYGVVA